MIISGKKTKQINELESVFRTLKRKYAYSVYPCEIEDLEQTIWYLILLAIEKYDESRGSLKNFAFYFANQKLKDHFWRRVNLPESKGNFTLLHMKAALVEDEDSLPDEERIEEIEELPIILQLKSEGYTLMEIAKKLKMSYGSVERRWKKHVEEIKKSRLI
jgi:DNA-directed RNA polymerase specialized sigma24 family protein